MIPCVFASKMDKLKYEVDRRNRKTKNKKKKKKEEEFFIVVLPEL